MSWLTLTRWEWFKVRGRRVTWALLAVLIFFSAVFVLIRFADYQFQKDREIVDELIFVPGAPVIDNFEVEVNCTRFLAGERPTSVPEPYTLDDVDIDATSRECRKEEGEVRARIDMLVDEFALPGSVGKALRWTELISVPLLAFFTVLVIGSEYGWGTLRSVLMRGTGRWRLLASKFAIILVAIAVAWLAILMTIILVSVIVTPFASGIDHGDIGGAIGDFAGDTARAWFSGLPYVALAAVLTILFSSYSGGVLAAAGLSILYFFVELFSVGRLIKLFDDVAAFRWFGSLVEYDLGWNTAAWMFGENGEPIPGFALAGAIGVADYPSDVHAFLVQLAYFIGLTALAFWLFLRRDVAGPSG